MREQWSVNGAIHSTLADTARWLRRHAVWLCAAGWTVLAGLILYWLLGGQTGPSVWIIDGESPGQADVVKTFHARFMTDVGIQRLYPWVLLGPYAALVAVYFPFERGRVWLSMSLNRVVCVAFIIASHTINTRTRMKFANVVIIKSSAQADSRESNQLGSRIIKTNPVSLLGHIRAQSPARENSSAPPSQVTLPGRGQWLPKLNSTNWQAHRSAGTIV